ncbi:MAG TPA: hypothetical protein VJR27_05670 [Candidatus Saccharimonadales bacterium]|nr:hypothetical protein [Candidatus Saccharimonadales bacterium]
MPKHEGSTAFLDKVGGIVEESGWRYHSWCQGGIDRRQRQLNHRKLSFRQTLEAIAAQRKQVPQNEQYARATRLIEFVGGVAMQEGDEESAMVLALVLSECADSLRTGGDFTNRPGTITPTDHRHKEGHFKHRPSDAPSSDKQVVPYRSQTTALIPANHYATPEAFLPPTFQSYEDLGIALAPDSIWEPHRGELDLPSNNPVATDPEATDIFPPIGSAQTLIMSPVRPPEGWAYPPK